MHDIIQGRVLLNCINRLKSTIVSYSKMYKRLHYQIIEIIIIIILNQ